MNDSSEKESLDLLLFLFYLHDFRISSINVAKATLHSSLRPSLQRILCITFNSLGLAFWKSPRNTSCASSSTEFWPAVDGLFWSSSVRATPNIFDLVSASEQLNPDDEFLFTSVVLPKVKSL